ncbi:MAG: NUDIX domain-containing protein [Phycisphaerae bacterium]|nr:NUDIX domain-containing protein [Phycisphaerae bacterium]
MPLKPKHCSQCGGLVEWQMVEGRQRAVCPACDEIFYENPLPVAAALVMNTRRELLLVRRKHEPHKGQWCLPMGFAETGETIAAAALRELKEEAGIDGRALRLLDADSFSSDHYGDLLVVTFEIEKTGGREQAGDDADAVQYFPVGRHPPLAFASNEKALGLCAAAHQEGWQIHDSFVTLDAETDKALLSDSLVALIEARAGEIADQWLADVLSSSTTNSYQKVKRAPLRERAVIALTQFGRWLKGVEAVDEVSAFYSAVGAERQAQGFAVQEVISSLMLLKKHVWSFTRVQGVWERPIDVYRVLELNRRMALFFDQATYHAARGYETRRRGRAT